MARTRTGFSQLLSGLGIADAKEKAIDDETRLKLLQANLKRRESRYDHIHV
jgi:hypothetical protein